MALQLDGDHAPRLGERCADGGQSTGGAEAAVNHNQRGRQPAVATAREPDHTRRRTRAECWMAARRHAPPPNEYPQRSADAMPRTVEHRDDVIPQRRVAQRPIGVGGVAMALQLDGDHAPRLGERCADGGQSTGGAEAAVHHDQRHAAGPPRLPVYAGRADRNVTAVDDGSCAGSRVGRQISQGALADVRW